MLLLSFFLLACPSGKDIYNTIIFENYNKIDDIFILYSTPFCNDSILPQSKPTLDKFRSCPYGSQQVLKVSFSYTDIQDLINNTPQKALTFYVFNKVVLDSMPWSVIVANNLFLKKYITTTSDVSKEANYTITYP